MMSGRDHRQARRMLETINGGSSRPADVPIETVPPTVEEEPTVPSEPRVPWNPDITLLTIDSATGSSAGTPKGAADAPRPKPFEDGAWGKGPFTIRTFQF